MLENKGPDGQFNKRNAELHQFKILNIPETQLVKCFQHFYLTHYLFIKYSPLCSYYVAKDDANGKNHCK